MYQIITQRAADAVEIEALLECAFGPRRWRKTSYRYRRGVAEAAALGLVARDGGQLVGTIRYWPIEIGGHGSPIGGTALLLGPLAVAPDRRGEGIGAELIDRGLDGARRSGARIVVAVGRLDYYCRFGFGTAAPHGIHMPGEAPGRLLVRPLADGALDQVSGPVRPWRWVRRRSAADNALKRLPVARPGSIRPVTAPAPATAATAALAGGR